MLATLVAIVLTAIANLTGTVQVEVPAPVTLPACAAEDSTNCYWDADVRGNGDGRSFVDIDGVVYYLNAAE